MTWLARRQQWELFLSLCSSLCETAISILYKINLLFGYMIKLLYTLIYDWKLIKIVIIYFSKNIVII
jgi:hypothetical protein